MENRPRHPGFTVRENYYNLLLPVDFEPKVIVDVGGLYDSCHWLRERFPRARLILTNIMAKHLDSVPDEWVEKHLGAAEKMHGIEGIDLIFLGEVLEHLVYPQEFLEIAVNSLHPGGRILLSTPNLATWHNRLLILFGYSPTNYSMIPGRHLGVPRSIARISGLGYGDHIRVFTYKALKELFSSAPWELEGILAAPAIAQGRPLSAFRNAFGMMMPPSSRESVFLCARLTDKVPPARAVSSGWIGSSASVESSS